MSINQAEVLPQVQSKSKVALFAITLAFFQVGLTAFGFSIVQKIKLLVIQKGWLSQEEVDEGMALVQLYPGPIMVDFTAYTGYKLRGVIGALLATLGFIMPSFVLIVILSAAYFASGSLPWVQPLFLGLEALIVGIILNVTFDFGSRSLKGRTEALIALAAFTALLFKVNAVLIVLGALALGALFLRPKGNKKGIQATNLPPATKAFWKTWVPILMVIVVILAGAGYSWLLNSDIGRMGLSFFKIGSVAFGNGSTILPLIQNEVLDTHHWLTPSQFADGIALGQITPGPFLIMSAFVGYKMGGLGAAALMTFAIFSPSFAMTLVFTKVFSKLKNLSYIKGALNGVLASFVGLLAVVVMQLGKTGITGPASLALAGTAFIGVHYLKLDILWVFLGGLMIWGGMLALGISTMIF
ncbi:MAG: chromate efflux transporter [Chloroflexi bacterium]|jgi:chromate transporter|nr:chromate efflux transporter [Chloroflexota bacterium]